MGRGYGCVQGSGQRGGLGHLPTPLVAFYAGGMCSTLLLLPTPCFCSRLFKSGRWVFLVSLNLLGLEFAPACTQLFLVPYSFFVFWCSRRGVSMCKHCSTAAKGPRSQQRFPAPSLSQMDLGKLLRYVELQWFHL